MRISTTLAVLAAVALLAPAAANAQGCDRRCLMRMLTDYTEALGDNDASHLPAAPGLKVTNNGAPARLGAGEVWGPDRRLPYRQAFVDPVTGQAVFYATVTTAARRGRPGETPAAGGPAPRWWFYVVRLKVAGRKLAEVEEIAWERPAGGPFADPASLKLPDRIWDTVLPPAERSTRKELYGLANAYFDAVSHRVDYHDVPWHPECTRLEMGAMTVNAPATSGSCGGEFKLATLKWNVENRRVVIADVERGVVIAAANFMTPEGLPQNTGSVVMEAFKVQDGMIRHIEAFMRPRQTSSGWGEGPGS